MNQEQFAKVTQAQHTEYVKEACTMATLSDAIDDILFRRDDLVEWFDDFEGGDYDGMC